MDIEFRDPSTLRVTENVYGPSRTDVGDILATLDTIEDIKNLPPVGIKPDGTVIYGHRRAIAASRVLESGAVPDGCMACLPVRVHGFEDAIELVTLAVEENETQRRATPYEQMHAYVACIKAGMAQKDAVTKFRNSQGQPMKASWGSMMSKIYEACQAESLFDSLFREGKINYTLAYNLAKAPAEDRTELLKLLKGIKDKSVSGGITTIESIKEAAKAATVAGQSSGDEESKDGEGRVPRKKDGQTVAVYLPTRQVAHTAHGLYTQIKEKVKAGEFEDGQLTFDSRTQFLTWFMKVLQGSAKLEGILKR